MSESKIDAAQGLAALSEATVDSLSELFNRNPLNMSEEDIKRIVEEYRKMRGRWAIAELAGKKSLSKAEPKQKSLPAPTAAKAPTDVEF